MGKPMTQREESLEFELITISGENTLLRKRNKELVDILDQVQSALADYQSRGAEGSDNFYDRVCANVTNYESLKP